METSRKISGLSATPEPPAGVPKTVTLDISKDNVQMGVRAVDANGNHSPVAFPTVVA